MEGAWEFQGESIAQLDVLDLRIYGKNLFEIVVLFLIKLDPINCTFTNFTGPDLNLTLVLCPCDPAIRKIGICGSYRAVAATEKNIWVLTYSHYKYNTTSKDVSALRQEFLYLRQRLHIESVHMSPCAMPSTFWLIILDRSQIWRLGPA